MHLLYLQLLVKQSELEFKLSAQPSTAQKIQNIVFPLKVFSSISVPQNLEINSY